MPLLSVTKKIGNEYIQYLKEGKEVHYKEKNGKYVEVN